VRTSATTDYSQSSIGHREDRGEWTLTNHITNGFDSIASSYDRWYDSPVNRAIDEFEKTAVKEALPAEARTELLLDAGCGTGHWLGLYRAAGCRVVGLDLSRIMLDVASTKFGSEFQLMRADTHWLPFKDCSFDIVCCIATLEFVSDRARTLSELHRCLKRGGRLIVGVLNALSWTGLKRKLLRSPTFRGAHFFTSRELKRCLGGYGEPHVTTCAYTPPCAALLPLASAFERIGVRVAPASGRLIVGWVEKQGVVDYEV
jgi:ubiquinone/menaquinone biosynthesis C-methylase UbiE